MRPSSVYYLRGNIQVEPLIDRWYAWSYLIPPVTAARNITERHLKIMASYVAAPEVHAAAVKNLAMRGGPFIDHGGERVEEIADLMAATQQQRAQLVALSRAIKDLDDLLRQCAKGYGLLPLYDKIPEMLRGYVELVYDLNDHPSFRLLESLLYRSPYYDRRSQSLTLSVITGDDRPFILSTPRLDSPDSINLDIHFDDERVDWLFALKRTPQPWNAIADRLPAKDDQVALLRSMFTEEPPQPYSSYRGKGVRWRYFGHACILIEADGVTMLFDPILSYTYESDLSRYTYADLPESIDFVLITHNHQDHILFETLLQLRSKIKHVIVPRNRTGTLQDPSVKLILQSIGFTSVIELSDCESLAFERGSITGLPFFGEHADLDIGSKLAYQIRLGSKSLLFLADSCNVEPYVYARLKEDIGPVDAMFIGMECDGAPLSWLYGPLLTRKVDRGMDGSRRLAGSNYDQAINIVDQLRPHEVYIYAMGQEPWLNYISSVRYTDHSRPIVDSNRVIEECKRRGIIGERLFGEKEVLLET